MPDRRKDKSTPSVSDIPRVGYARPMPFDIHPAAMEVLRWMDIHQVEQITVEQLQTEFRPCPCIDAIIELAKDGQVEYEWIRKCPRENTRIRSWNFEDD